MVADRSYRLFVGIEVAEATFTASWTPARTAPRHRPVTLSQSSDGYTALIEQLQATTVTPATTFIVLEATGKIIGSHSRSRSTKRGMRWPSAIQARCTTSPNPCHVAIKPTIWMRTC